jgi:hypothetical protein
MLTALLQSPNGPLGQAEYSREPFVVDKQSHSLWRLVTGQPGNEGTAQSSKLFSLFFVNGGQ